MRISYLHYLLKQDQEGLLYNYLDAQVRNPVRGDWALLVQEDIASLGLALTFDDVARMSGNALKSKLKVAVKCAAFKYLTELQQTHSKSKNLIYSDLKLQDYLRSGGSGTIDQKAKLFQIRSRMLDLKTNFKSTQENTMCSLCDIAEETQPHLLSCGALTSHSLIRSDRPVPVYVEDASRVETIGLLLMEKFDQFKRLRQNPDAHCIVSNICNSIVRAASGGNTRGIG